MMTESGESESIESRQRNRVLREDDFEDVEAVDGDEEGLRDLLPRRDATITNGDSLALALEVAEDALVSSSAYCFTA
eukprot:4986741-Prymnesium_polylepis.1